MDTVKKKILIVDDEVDLCNVLSWEFEDAGMEVLVAHSGNQAIEVLAKSQVDYVLTDIKMPNGDGVSLLDHIAKERVPVSEIYIMTGYTEYAEEILLEKGAKKVLFKPIDADDVINELKIT